MSRDWVAWHDEYDDPGSRLSRRLVVVRRFVARAIDAQPPGPIRVVSMCAGTGRDVIPVVASHRRRSDVQARLVELDPSLAAAATAAATDAGLGHSVDVVCGDAARTDAYDGAVPAGVVLACGIFGNVTADDVRRTVLHLPHLCAPGAWVVWTRHPRSPQVIADIKSWFAEAGFADEGFEQEDGSYGVGCDRLEGEPEPFVPGEHLFRFVK